MRAFWQALKPLAWLGIVVLLGYYSGYIRISVLERSLSELEKECIVATIHSDARWAGDVEEAVRREIARTVIRHAREYRRDVCDVFRLGLTLVPPGYKRLTPGYFRSERYVRNSLEATEASWKSDLQLVEQVLKEKGANGCATHYVRKSRMSDFIAQSSLARTEMRATMRSVGKARSADGKEVGDAEFFCSKTST